MNLYIYMRYYINKYIYMWGERGSLKNWNSKRGSPQYTISSKNTAGTLDTRTIIFQTHSHTKYDIYTFK